MTNVERILIVGGGGREHALALALSRPGRCVNVTPGNAGIARSFACIPGPMTVEDLVARARALSADLVVVGPEQPLVDGLVDALQAAGICALGPSAKAAMLEGSKAFMKEICAAAKVRTARHGVFESPGPARDFAASLGGRVVVKADGLCAGKGVALCADLDEASRTINAFLGERPGAGAYSAASARIVVEEFLAGHELSVLGLCDGHDALLFAPARDHKQLRDGGKGPNTGGMGAVAPLGPSAGIDEVFLDDVRRSIFVPVLDAMRARGTPYRGILYAGLMLTDAGPAVLEFNVRLGDPEAQAVLFGTDVDLLPLFAAVAAGERLPKDAPDLVAACRPTCAVVLASPGYPHAAQTGTVLTEGPPGDDDACVFFAGVTQDDDTLVTAGGRVLTCTARGPTLAAAVTRAYALADAWRFPGCQRRSDIGRSALGGGVDSYIVSKVSE